MPAQSRPRVEVGELDPAERASSDRHRRGSAAPLPLLAASEMRPRSGPLLDVLGIVSAGDRAG